MKTQPIRALLEEQVRRAASAPEATRQANEETGRRMALGATSLLEEGRTHATRQDLMETGDEVARERRRRMLSNLRAAAAKRRNARRNKSRTAGTSHSGSEQRADTNRIDVSAVDFSARGASWGLLRPIDEQD